MNQSTRTAAILEHIEAAEHLNDRGRTDDSQTYTLLAIAKTLVNIMASLASINDSINGIN